MKQLLLYFLLLHGIYVFAQPKTITQAIITTKTTIISSENDDENIPSAIQPSNGEMRIIRLGGEGETKSLTYLKNDLTKTIVNNETGRTTIIRDNGNKKTTTLLEMMGKKTGFYTTDEEQEQMGRQMDSLLQTSKHNIINEQAGSSRTVIDYNIIYTDENKKIAGLTCKKALLITTKINGNKDTIPVWYNPEIKLKGIITTGQVSGLGNLGRSNNINTGLGKIDGFVMEYQTKSSKGRIMKTEVIKLETEKQLADKDFEIPKDFELKPLKEMQNSGRNGSFQIKIGG